jgi:hypothetical protein
MDLIQINAIANFANSHQAAPSGRAQVTMPHFDGQWRGNAITRPTGLVGPAAEARNLACHLSKAHAALKWHKARWRRSPPATSLCSGVVAGSKFEVWENIPTERKEAAGTMTVICERR